MDEFNETLPDYIIKALESPLIEEKDKWNWDQENMLPIKNIKTGNINIEINDPINFPFKPITEEQIEFTLLKAKVRQWSNTLTGKDKKKFDKFFNL